MNPALAKLLESQPLVRWRKLAGEIPSYLVGGAVRDALLGRPVRDLDLVLSHHAEELAERWVAAHGGRLIRLGGDEFGALRIVSREVELDLWDRGTMTFEDDLGRRDLTINAIAIDVGARELRDPFGGETDLAAKVLRAPRSTAFAEDPLRVLRLARFAAELPEFTVDSRTLAWAKASRRQLPQIASERIRHEWESLLDQPGWRRGLKVLWQTEAALELLGEIGEGDFSTVATALATVEHQRQQLSQQLPDAPQPDASVRRAAVLATLALSRKLNRTGVELDPLTGTEDPASTDDVIGTNYLASKGYFRKQDLRTMDLLGRLATELVGHSATAVDDIELRWLLHRSADAWPGLVELTAALETAGAPQLIGAPQLTGTPQLRSQVLFDCIRDDAETILRPPALLDGGELATLAGISPGKSLGKLIQALRKAQVSRQVETPEEAREFARAWSEELSGS